MTRAVYPGGFDPVTNGHADIARRAAGLFDELVVGVAAAPVGRGLLFTTEERIALFNEAIKDVANCRVVQFDGLTTDFARRIGADVMVRGLRSATDFEREFDMHMMYKHLADELEIVFLVTEPDYQFVSASLLKEVAAFHGDIRAFVPPHVAAALEERLGH